MDIVSRIKHFMEVSQLTPSRFADTAGIPRPTLSQLLNGRPGVKEGVKKVSNDFIDKIHRAYPRLNVMWLLFGEGDMEIETNNGISDDKNAHIESNTTDEDSDYQSYAPTNLFDNDFQSYDSEKSFVHNPFETSHQNTPTSESPTSIKSQPSSERTIARTTIKNDSGKRIQSIMIFYNDNSFEVFKPEINS